MSGKVDPVRPGESIYHVESSDPDGVLVDRSGLTPDDIAQVNRVMSAMNTLRRAEERLSEASTRYMKLNKTDMRALHFIIVTQNRGEFATPGEIAHHLEISSAATTKLLDRLARGGHITREPHPSDRRALMIRVTPHTHQSARETVGRQHAKRFVAAARLSPAEREVVSRFLEDLATELSSGYEHWSRESPEE